VSRATVRKVIRGHRTEFKYERAVQPSPKLGDWVEVLTEILEQEADLPKRERRSTQRLFEELRGRVYDGAHDSVHRFAKAWLGLAWLGLAWLGLAWLGLAWLGLAWRARACSSQGLCADELRA
jgi:hypothetical protein